MENLLPKLQNKNYTDGVVIHSAKCCKEKWSKESCAKFYKQIEDYEDGLYECPGGYTVFHKKTANGSVFYSGFRVKNHYKKVSYKNAETNYVIPESLFWDILGYQEKLDRIFTETEHRDNIHNDLLHDIKKLDSQILYKSQDILRSYSDRGNEYKEILHKIKNINAMEELISCKYNVHDLALNIQALSLGTNTMVHIYKKFDKVRYILMGYKNKNVVINFRGETDFKYNMKTSYAEILPFLLLENAVKYTMGDKTVEVVFEEIGDNLYVSIESFGPYCEDDELGKIFEKNYRGRNTLKHNSDGNGVGLFLVREICNQFNIDIRITSEYEKTINGIKYGSFKVALTFYEH